MAVLSDVNHESALEGNRMTFKSATESTPADPCAESEAELKGRRPTRIKAGPDVNKRSLIARSSEDVNIHGSGTAEVSCE